MSMKLNNKGWGLATMLICSGIIVLFLLVAAFFTLRLNSYFKDYTSSSSINSKPTTFYLNQTAKLTEASEKYVKSENIQLVKGEKTRIELNTLIHYNYINYIIDTDDNYCDGYSLASIDSDDILNINSYIKCDNYMTKGYGEY